MKKKLNKNTLSLILSTMLIVAMALCMTACGGNKDIIGGADGETSILVGEETTEEVTYVLGGGKTVFFFSVVNAEGKERKYEIHTDKTMVGEALLEFDLIAGEDGPYGLYVKTVDGVTLDYDKDGMYWSFYINGEYGMTGVDVTPITAGESYSFRAEKS